MYNGYCGCCRVLGRGGTRCLFPWQHDQNGAVVVVNRQSGRLNVFRHTPDGAFDERSILNFVVH